MNGAVSI